MNSQEDKFLDKVGVEMNVIKPTKYFRYMILKSKKYFPMVLLLQVSTLTLGLANLKIADITQSFIDGILIRTHATSISDSITSLVIAGITLFLLSLINNYISSKLINLLSYSVRSDFLKSMEYHNFAFFSKNSSSEIYYRMFQDTAVMIGFFINVFVSLPVQIVYITIVLSKMLDISVPLSIYALFLLAVQVLGVIIFKRPIKALVIKQKSNEQEVVYNVNEQFQKIEVIKTLGIEEALCKKFDRIYETYISSNVKNSFLLKLFSSTTELINQIWLFGAIFISGILLKEASISLGEIFSFLIISRTFFNPVLKLLNTLINYEECRVSFSRFKEFYGFPPKGPTAKSIHKLQNVFSIKGLTFCYDNNNVIFDNVTLTFHAGDFIAIKGSSGIGKTTLFRIISRFLEPQRGILSIDGVNIQFIDNKTYIEDFGLLLQTPIIFDDTIKFNLTFNKNYSDEELFDILEAVDLKEFVNRQSDKLNTLVGVRGIRLSEGQAQRLSLARILLRKPKILWLDEPTAQLDFNNKNEILNIVDAYRKKENALIVISSHDPLVLNRVDTIYEIKNHKITPLENNNTDNFISI